MIGRSDDDGGGYHKPPRKNQFKPGQSGNPAGRPRRKREEVKFPGIDPTRDFIRSEASRTVSIREGDKKLGIPATQAVMRALGVKAMQGGVLAARTFLEHQLREDALIRAEREKSFKIWSDYIDRTQAELDRADKRGVRILDPVPHPADIELNYATLEVTFLGPIDEEQERACRRIRAMCELHYELIIFCNENKNGMPTDERPIYGLNTFMYASLLPSLPPRLRGLREGLEYEVFRRATGPRRQWIQFLKERLKEHGFDIDPAKMNTRYIDLRDANLRLGKGGFEHYRWPKRKGAK